MDFMSDPSLPTPTPSPSSSSSDNSSLLNTFEMESFSSLENGRLLKNKNHANTNMDNVSSNSVLGSTLEKNNILNNWQKTRINKNNSHKPKLDGDKRRNNFGIIEEDITETSDIISNGLHKSLQSLPEEPISKLMNNTVEDSLMNLKLITMEKEKLKKSNKLLFSANEDLQRQVDSLKQENANLLNQLNSMTNSDKTSKSSEQVFTIDSLVKKLQKYKFISQEQESIIKDLRKQLEAARQANRVNKASEQQQQQSQQQEKTGDLQQKDSLLDNTDFLISMNSLNVSQGFQNSIRKPAIHNDIQKSRDMPDYNYSGQNKNYFDNHQEKSTAIQASANRASYNNEKVTNEKEKEFSEELDIIKKMVKELRPLLEYVSSTENVKDKREELNKNSPSVDKNLAADKKDRQDTDETHSSANDFLKSLSERVDKKKKLQKELVDLENDEYIKMIEKISNPIDLSQKEYKAKPLRVGDLLLDEQDFINLLQSNKRKQKANIDLQTLKSLNNNVGSDTWIDDSYEGDYEENSIAPRLDFNNFSYLDDILQTTKNEFTELINKFNTLYNDTLKTDPTHNFRANKRSIHVLLELLQQINTKRQLIYKLSQTLKKGLREPKVNVSTEAATSDDRYIDNQLVW